MKRFLSLLIVLIAAPAGAAPVAAPGYALRTIPTPGTVQGGVVERDGAILVGQGSFGAGLQSIIRLDGSGVKAKGTVSAGGGVNMYFQDWADVIRLFGCYPNLNGANS